MGRGGVLGMVLRGLRVSLVCGWGRDTVECDSCEEGVGAME